MAAELERMSADDLAAQRAGEFQAASIAAALRSTPARTPGVCLNCGAHLTTLAAYCDPDCQADHEERQAILKRKGCR